MAAPITHIVLTEKIYDKYFSHFNKRDFILGTSFPDIRYLTGKDRNLTHFKNLKLSDVLDSKNSFMAGMKFHSLIDEERQLFIRENKVFENYDVTPTTTHAIKIIEDQLLYPKVNNWNEIANYFQTIPQEALSDDIDKTTVQKWFRILETYCKQPVTKDSISQFLTQIGFTGEKIQALNKEIVMLKSMGQNCHYILDFYSQIFGIVA